MKSLLMVRTNDINKITPEFVAKKYLMGYTHIKVILELGNG